MDAVPVLPELVEGRRFDKLSVTGGNPYGTNG